MHVFSSSIFHGKNDFVDKNKAVDLNNLILDLKKAYMAQNHFPGNLNNNNRRMDNYEYELKKLMEQERRSMAMKVRIRER